MILLTLSRGNEHERVHLRLPASPAEIGEAFVILDGISLDTTTTAILDVRGNVPGLYRYLYDVDVEDSEQFQKLQQLAERTDALSPEKAAIFSGALDAEHAENLDEALAVANRLDEYMLIGNITSDSELGAYLVDKGITPFPDRFKPYINYARVGAEYREKHDGVYLDDSIILERVVQKLKVLAHSPACIQLPKAAPASTDALRIENELALCFNRADINPEYMKTLIMAAAAERYAGLNDPTPAHRLALLRQKLELEPENEETLWELFESAVTHVCIGKGGEISLSQKDQKECAS